MSKTTIVLAAVALAALTSCRSNVKPSNSAPLQTAAALSGAPVAASPPSCNGESPVWAIEGAKVYLLPGDRLYGKTKRGQYMCLSQAQAEGYHGARHPFRHHHHRHSSS
ncbi:MAG: hypothetical protein JOZ77_02585 [Candidatus Eremiobacteraeota bacterium]|nr:hypothetical protein [Candidatus Eremiobacteraeota bacterium]